MTTVRCKALCTSVKKYAAGGNYTDPKVDFLYEATFCAVSGGTSPENKKFFASTPTLELRFAAINGDLFQPGKEYYLDLSMADPVAA